MKYELTKLINNIFIDGIIVKKKLIKSFSCESFNHKKERTNVIFDYGYERIEFMFFWNHKSQLN